MTDNLVPSSGALVEELRSMTKATRGRVAQTVNSELVELHWQVGKRSCTKSPASLRPSPTRRLCTRCVHN